MTDSNIKIEHGKYSALPYGSISLCGTADGAVRWIEREQLLEASLWADFVNEYRVRTDDGDNAWRGEYWGKLLRGAVTVYQYTRDEKLYRILSDTVRDMMSTQEENGRISTYRQEHDFSNWDIWSRKYVMLSMEYFLEICKEPEFRDEIIGCLCRQCDYLCDRIGDASEGKLPITGTTRIYGGMNSASVLEPVVRLYRLTGEGRYLKLAEHIVSTGGSMAADIFSLALEDKVDPYAYGVSKAYEMMSCFEGLLEYYYATGIDRCRRAVINFARRVIASDVTVIGSCGCTHELFDHAAVRQSRQAGEDEIMQETCVTVTWMKFCRSLFLLTGDPVFADCIETSYYNAYLGALNCGHHRSAASPVSTPERPITDTFLAFDSYSPLTAGERGRRIGGLQVLANGRYFGCCACIGAAGAGIFAGMQAMYGTDGVLLCFYENGEITAKTPTGKPLKLKTESAYPFGDGRVTVTVSVGERERFCLSLRLPHGFGARVTVCGDEYEAVAGITDIVREWSDGDTVSVEFDMRVRCVTAPVYDTTVIHNIDWATGGTVPTVEHQEEDARDRICLISGPVVLAAEKGLTREDIRTPFAPVIGTDGFVEGHAADVPGYLKTVAVADKCSGEVVLCSYSSAGKSWNDETEFGAWLPVSREYMASLRGR